MITLQSWGPGSQQHVGTTGLHVLGRIDKPSSSQQLQQLIIAWSPVAAPAGKEDGPTLTAGRDRTLLTNFELADRL
jgi:hypothetical protein